MKEYDVYAIGNALVDEEIEVATESLRDLNIDKGVMTLVDEDKYLDLLKNMKGARHNRTCGGSAANTVIGLSCLGGSTFLSCKVSEDETGNFYYKNLKECGVNTNLNNGLETTGKTGHCLVFITPDADRTMNTYLGITATFSKSELIEKEIVKSKYLYIESYLLTGPNGTEAAILACEIARKNNVKVAITLSDPAIVEHFHTQILDVKGNQKFDLIFCNEDEAKMFTKTDNIDEAIQEMQSFTNDFVITRGSKGATIYNNNNLEIIETEAVKAIDTNGAGDLFAGAYLYGITNGYSSKQSGELACAASTKLVTKFGARLTEQELLKIKSEIK
jgi:sugar/nucleoside kinase (ribokinase family)